MKRKRKEEINGENRRKKETKNSKPGLIITQ